MVEVYVPFLLVFMSWNAADPDNTMQVQTELYLDRATCEMQGAERQKLVDEDRAERMNRFSDAAEMIRNERSLFRCVRATTSLRKAD